VLDGAVERSGDRFAVSFVPDVVDIDSFIPGADAEAGLRSPFWSLKSMARVWNITGTVADDPSIETVVWVP